MTERALVVNFIGNTAGLEAALKRTSMQLNGLQAAGSKMQSVGASMTRGLTVPILAVGAASADLAVKFQASMERIHTQAGVGQSAVNQLSKSVLNMAGSVGTAPKDLAAAMYHVASSLNATIVPAQRQSTELRVLKIAAEGAQVGGANLVDVTNALDAVVVSGISGIQNFSQGMGALNAIVGAGDMSMQDLSEALGTGLLATMKIFGVTLKETGGALAVFGDNNIRGAEAATKLGSAIRIMAAPSGAGANALATIGLGSLDLANKLRSPNGLVGALSLLKQHLIDSGQTSSEQAATLTAAFGRKQSTGVLLLISQLDRLRAKTTEVGAGAQGFGEAWAATQKTAAFQLHAGLATMEADLTRFGASVMPILLPIGHTIVKDADAISHAFSSLPKGAQEAIIHGGLLLAAIGPAMKVLGLFTGGIGRLWALGTKISAVAGFGKAASPLASELRRMSVAEMTVGTMIVKTQVGGGKGVPAVVPPVVEGAGAGITVEAAAAARLARLTAGIGAGTTAGVLGLASASHAQGGALNQLNAIAHGIDPTSVLHLAGLPSVSDLLPTVKKRMPLSAADIGRLGEGFPANSLGYLSRLQAGTASLGARGANGQIIRTSLGGTPATGSNGIGTGVVGLDIAREQSVIQSIGKTNTAVSDLAKAFSNLSKTAKAANDLPFSFADRVASDMIKAKGVNKSVISDMTKTLASLPPSARAQAASAAIGMAQQLQAKGALPKGSAEDIRKAITASFTRMGGDVTAQTGLMATGVENSFAAIVSSAQMLVSAISSMAQSVKTDISSLFSAAATSSISGITSNIAGTLSQVGAPAVSTAGALSTGSTYGINPSTGVQEKHSAGAWAGIYATYNRVKAAKAAAAARKAAQAAKGGSTTATTSLPVDPFATAPSQAVSVQIEQALLANRLAAAQATNNIAAQNKVLAAELKLNTVELAADRKRLAAIKQALLASGLSQARRSQLLADQLATVQEIGTVQGNIAAETPDPFAVIPSQAAALQARIAVQANKLLAAQNANNIGGQQKVLGAQLKLAKSSLKADKAQLAKIVHALHGAIGVRRAKLLQDRLALLTEIGTVLGNIGSISSSLTGLTGAGTSASTGQFDLAPGGASVKLPTTYDVKRPLTAARSLERHDHHHGNITNHYHLKIEKGAEQKVVDLIDRTTGSRLHAQMRMRGYRGT